MTFETDGDEGPRSRRRRWIGGVAAAAIVAAAAGAGYGVGRSVDSGDAITSGAPATITETTPPSTVEGTVHTAPTVPATASATIDGAGDPEAAILEGPYPAHASGEVGWSHWSGVDLVFLGERRRDDGLLLRAQRTEWWDDHHDPTSSWMPAPWCFPSAEVRIAAVDDTIVDVGTAGWYREPFEGRAVSTVMLGLADGAPIWAIAVQAPPDTTRVEVVAPDGSSDAVAPVDGVALLALPAPATTEELDRVDWRPTFDVVFEGGEGGSIAVASGEVGQVDHDTWQAGCEPPPPALPPPGEQPADPIAAEASIVGAMGALYQQTEIGSESAYLDEDEGVVEAREQVRDGGFADAASSVSAVVEELVFTAPDAAMFRYRLETSAGTFDDRFGRAVEIDAGDWRITRDTFCQDLSLAGGNCGRFAPVVPPSQGEGVVPD